MIVCHDVGHISVAAVQGYGDFQRPSRLYIGDRSQVCLSGRLRTFLAVKVERIHNIGRGQCLPVVKRNSASNLEHPALGIRRSSPALRQLRNEISVFIDVGEGIVDLKADKGLESTEELGGIY